MGPRPSAVFVPVITRAGTAVYGPRSPEDLTRVLYQGDGTTAHLLDPATAAHVRALGWEAGHEPKAASATPASRSALKSLRGTTQ